MKISGDNIIHAPVERAWDALLDPAVLVRTIPGCERLAATGEHTYDMTVTAGVASIKGTYSGTCELSDLHEHESLVMRLAGAGAPGTIGADVDVTFTDLGDGTTRIGYAADAIVGGMIGGVGQRMLSSVSRKMAGEFFGNVDAVLRGAMGVSTPDQPANAPAAPGQVFTPPAPAPSSQQDFLKGVALGAGLVLLGVVAGGVFWRR
ncbi:MAG: carbon monoxide dehydrogenase subunit G [Nocardioides sp.]|jgi:carbon monoxide dehydrogenase subunit G